MEQQERERFRALIIGVVESGKAAAREQLDGDWPADWSDDETESWIVGEMVFAYALRQAQHACGTGRDYRGCVLIEKYAESVGINLNEVEE